LKDEITLLKSKLTTTNIILEKNLDWMAKHLEVQSNKIDSNNEAVKGKLDGLRTESSKQLVDHFSRSCTVITVGKGSYPKEKSVSQYN
jgi:hypothetical protein